MDFKMDTRLFASNNNYNLDKLLLLLNFWQIKLIKLKNLCLLTKN